MGSDGWWVCEGGRRGFRIRAGVRDRLGDRLLGWCVFIRHLRLTEAPISIGGCFNFGVWRLRAGDGSRCRGNIEALYRRILLVWRVKERQQRRSRKLGRNGEIWRLDGRRT